MRYLPAVLCVFFFAAVSPAAEAKKGDEKKTARSSKVPERKPVESKDDGEAYDPEAFEKFAPLPLTPMTMKRLGIDAKAWNDVKKWSRIRKDISDKPEDQKQTYLALPLKYPVDERTWSPAPYALKYRITTTPTFFFGIDLNGDGRYSGRPENYNKNKDGSFGPITIMVKHEDGLIAPYSVIIAPDPEENGRYFRFRGNMAWKGYLPSRRKMRDSEQVVLVDANNNGLFNDYGVDLIKIGKKPLAPLAQLVLIKRRLYHLRVHPSGSRVWVKPYSRASGRLDMLKNFHPPKSGDLQSLLIINQTGTTVLDVAPSSSKRVSSYPCQVPAGIWYVYDGVIAVPREGLAHIYHGDMETLNIQEGETLAPEYGAPFSLSADITHNITGISVDKIRIVGRAKEEYVTFGKSAPKIEVKFKGRLVAAGYAPIGPEGLYEAYAVEPPKKGIYTVEVSVKSLAFGRLKIKPVEIAHHPFTH